MSSSDASGNAYPNGANSQLATGGAANQGQPNGLYIENTIIIQYDAQVQEIWDQARKLRCTWYDYYEKSVTFRPYNVDMLDAVTANFLGDNIQCWMQIQVGKGKPFVSKFKNKLTCVSIYLLSTFLSVILENQQVHGNLR